MPEAVELTQPARSYGRVRAIIAWSLGIALLLALVAGLGFYWTARASLPQLDGSIQTAGLGSPVTVIRDHHGVPSIEAASLPDLFFVQGYITAQDRLWQMDIMRRFAAGDLAELLGEDLLKHDRQQRILGLRVAAENFWNAISPKDRANFEAYARGVNAYIDSLHGHLPLEFRILGYSPRAWTPIDSELIGAQLIEDLNYRPALEALQREKILAKLGPELTSDLYVNSSWHDRPPTVSRPSLDQDQDKDENDDDEDDDDSSGSSVVRLIHGTYPQSENPQKFVEGSNDWVVSGAHTVTGKPLLCDDMHLGHSMPNLWYEIHLHSGNLDVAGVSLPGLPYVIVGHNQRIAWGFTNVGPTAQDVYIEQFNSDGKYQTPGGWLAPERRPEVIHVKGKPDVQLDVLTTRHGPIVSDLIPGESRKVALRWTLYQPDRNPFFEVDSAQNWNDFRAALSELDAAGQNAVYADVDGNIGYQATGKIPIRASGDGSLPEDGTTDKFEWTGYIPYDKMPSVYNPPSGIVATANGRITPDGYPYSISVGWEAPWRTSRIYRVLESGKKFSSADMLALQTDIFSEFDRFVADQLVYAIDHSKNPTPQLKTAADILRNWDGRMSVDSAGPTIAVRAREELVRLLLEPKLGVASKDPQATEAQLSWRTYDWQEETVWLENVLEHKPDRWLPTAYSSYDDLLVAATTAALDQAPDNLSTWKWGYYNPVEIRHPIFGRFPILRMWAGPGLQPQSGSRFTVKAVSRDHGPSERFTADLSNLDHSTLNTVTGQAGNLFSPYFIDQWKAWYEGFTFVLPFSAQAVQSEKAHQLVLEPVR
jgi:penicillin amidase